MPSRPPTSEFTNERPVKRRRIEIPYPDSDLTSPKPQHKLTIPKFSSAFDNDDDNRPSLEGKRKPVSERTYCKPPSSSKKTNLVPIHDVHKSILPLQKKNVAHLRPAPPPPQIPSSSSVTPLKQAITTLSFEHGGQDLATSRHPDMPAVDAGDPPGLYMSPEKKGKGNIPKHVRGGLAGQASAFFDRSKTSLLLWQKDIEHRSKALPDLSVTVLKVLHEPIPPSRRTKFRSLPLAPGIALCRIHQQKEFQKYALDTLYKIGFSFSASHLAERFREGQNVQIYWPWQEISFTQPDPPLDDACSHIPASLASTVVNFPLNDVMLLCSRFLISQSDVI